MFVINILTSFYHLKAKFNKTIIVLSWELPYSKQDEFLFPLEETIVRSIITYSKLKSSNMFKQPQIFWITEGFQCEYALKIE